MKKIVMTLMMTLMVSSVEASPVIIKNNPLEHDWIGAKQNITDFDCNQNHNCSILTKYLGEQPNINTINNAVNKLITYTRETSDNWNTVSETFNSRRGDCEDFVIAKVALLKYYGYDMDKVDVHIMEGKDIYHLSLSFDNVQMDYMDLDGFQTLFTMKYNEGGLYVNSNYSSND